MAQTWAVAVGALPGRTLPGQPGSQDVLSLIFPPSNHCHQTTNHQTDDGIVKSNKPLDEYGVFATTWYVQGTPNRSGNSKQKISTSQMRKIPQGSNNGSDFLAPA